MNLDALLPLSLSVLFGGILGLEREYRSKSAGFRTITVITLGSTLFTIVSMKAGSPPTAIISGVGFIGAGVIFKEGYSVSGLTTAGTIWIAAALGMTLGIGYYETAVIGLLLSVPVLALFEKLQQVIDSHHQIRYYKIGMPKEYKPVRASIETELQKLNVKFELAKITQPKDSTILVYKLSATHQELEGFSEFLANCTFITFFDD